MKSNRTGQRRGFTIIELLVVITIMALLISMLLPSLSKARTAAKQMICATRLHQLDLGLMAYVADSKDNLPFESTAYFWNEEQLMQRLDPAGGLPNVGPIDLGKVYSGGYARDGRVWGCPASDYTLAPDRRVVCWTPDSVYGVQDDGLGAGAVVHGWFYYGPITTANYVTGTGDYVPYTKMSQRDPSYPAISDRYFRTDTWCPVDVIAHGEENINVVRNDGAIWRHANPLWIRPPVSWSDNPSMAHPWNGAGQGTAAIAQ